MNRIARATAFLAFVTAAGVAGARGPSAPSPEQLEMQRIVETPGQDVAQKVERLRAMMKDHGAAALPWIYRLDPEAAVRVAVERVADPAVPREEKLRIADTMMRREIGAAEFIDAYAPVLVELVVHGGAAEMLQPKEEGTPTAVGQYAWVASDFGGFASKDFPKVADRRVIPVLIECLSAPDELNRADAHVLRGRPGDPTGRNTQRQQVPVALAKLGAVEAVPRLVETIKTHRDYWLRYHASYAVGLLGDARRRGEVERFLAGGDDQERWMLFGFGHGLVRRGLPEGFKYFTFEHSTYGRSKDLFSALHVAEERVAAAKGVKAKEAKAFYRYVLSFGPLRDLLLFDESKVVVPDGMIPKGGSEKDVLHRQAKRIEKLYGDILEGIVLNGFTGLAAEIVSIGDATKNESIKRRSAEAAAKLRGN